MMTEQPLRTATRARSVPRILSDETGATMVEYTIIVAAIAIPMYFLFRIAMDTLLGHYAMMTFLNGWPFP